MQTETLTKPWLSQYPDYIKPEIDPPKFSSLLDMFEHSRKLHPDRPAYENMDKTLSYAEIDSLSNDFAAFLQNDCGLKPGDRFVIQMPNLLQFPVAMLAAMKAGLILVNTNPLYTPREMEHQFRDSGAVAIVILANFAHNLEQIIAKTNIKTVIVTEIGDLFGGLKKVITNFVVKNVKKMVPAYSLPGAIPFNTALEKGKKSKVKRHTWRKDDTAFLQYTGGTTGLSKGAELTHNNVISNIAQMMPFISVTRKGPLAAGDVAIIPLPMYHIFALTASFVFMSTGMKCLLVTNPRDFDGFIKMWDPLESTCRHASLSIL